MEQLVVGVVAFLDVGATQTGIEVADSLVKTTAVRLGTAATVDAVGDKNIGDFGFVTVEFRFEILGILASLTGSHIAQTLTEGIDEVLGVGFAREIYGSILRQLVPVYTGTVASLSFDEALPFVAAEVGRHPGGDVYPLPLDGH